MHSIFLHPWTLLCIQWGLCSLALSIRPSATRSILIHASIPIVVAAIDLSRTYVRTVWASFFPAVFLLNYVQLLALTLVGDSSPQDKNSSKDHVLPISKRLIHGLVALTDWRRVLHPPTSPKIPSFLITTITSRSSFIRYHLLQLAVTYLLLDAMSLNPPPDDKASFAPAKVTVLTTLFHGLDFSLEDLTIRIIVTIMTWLNLYVMIQFLTSLYFIFIVCLDWVPYQTCRPMFGQLSSATNIRQFWGTFWHQLLRFNHTTVSEFIVHRVLTVPRTWRLVSKYAKMSTVFGISGILHLVADLGGGMDLKLSGTMRFFLIQTVGIMIEDGTGALYRNLRSQKSLHTTSDKSSLLPMWQKALGYIWLSMWLLWTTPSWIYPNIINSNGSRLIPFSVIQMKWTT